MGEVVIRAEGLGKLYALGEQLTQYGRLSETVSDAVARGFRRLRGRPPAAPLERGELWALRDIDLTVEQGEVLGVIGRNGAGKTTLLKLLSRITEPTTGYAELHGRVGSLLEVGTGFHPELTGRDNIFLNGAILGMPRRETARKFDEIVSFAEVERFVDTPVKRYSSGMYLRLAFSVAAHLDPDILIVDEVLAVGDAAFQKKCLGKMQDVSRTGRTVLFVSHNMATVMSLCETAVLLEAGRIAQRGQASEVVQSYLSAADRQTGECLAERADRKGDGRLRVSAFSLIDAEGAPATFLQTGADAAVALDYASADGGDLPHVVVTLAIDTLFGERIVVLQNAYTGDDFPVLPPRGRIVCRIPSVPLLSGLYTTTISISVNGIVADWIIGAASIRVEPGDYYGTGRYPESQDGKFLIAHAWSVEETSS